MSTSFTDLPENVRQLPIQIVRGELQGIASNFSLSLSEALRRGRVSDKQRFYAHKLAGERLGLLAGKPKEIVDIDATGIEQLFGNALRFEEGKRVLSYPRITLRAGTRQVVLKPSPKHNYNRIYVTNGGRRDVNVYYGAIENGKFSPASACVPEIVELLRNLGESPVEVAKSYARQTGCCCFCGLTLTDQRSIDASYGPICAENYGLPWG